MKTLTEAAFLAWADRAGLCLDPQFPESAVLVFRPDPRQDRFWEVPVEPERRPYFLLSFLELMGDWQECYVWRHLGSWPEAAEPPHMGARVRSARLETDVRGDAQLRRLQDRAQRGGRSEEHNADRR